MEMLMKNIEIIFLRCQNYNKISVKFISDDNQIVLLISDNGSGIPEDIEFETSGKTHTLNSVFARAITVELVPDGELDGSVAETLAEVGHGETVRVLGIRSGLQGPQRRRLLDLGLVPGTEVEAELSSAGGDPVAYRIRGALIALRKDQSRWIQVDRKLSA